MKFSIENVEALRSILISLPRNQPKHVSKHEAIASLASELAAAQRRGHSADDLARLLSEKGITINGATLRNYLRRPRKQRRPRSSVEQQQTSTGNPRAVAPHDIAAPKGEVRLPPPAAKGGHRSRSPETSRPDVPRWRSSDPLSADRSGS